MVSRITSGRFTQQEIATTLELVDEALSKGEESGYIDIVLEIGKGSPPIRGYVH